MKTILVLGSQGLLGEAITRVAATEQRNDRTVLAATRDDGDLTQPGVLERLYEDTKPDVVINCAAFVGSRVYNAQNGAEMYERNKAIHERVLGFFPGRVEKLISFLCACCYGDTLRQPWDEKRLKGGKSKPNMFCHGYSRAKLECYRTSIRRTQETGTACINLLPGTMYGRNDNYSLSRGHVVANLIRRFWDADGPIKVSHRNATREFVFADDVARTTLWAVDSYVDNECLIVSTGISTSVQVLAETVARELGHGDDLLWGGWAETELTRQMNSGKFRGLLSDFEFTPLETGIYETVAHFVEMQPNLRGFD